jgi:long-chain acyl-CoA synthetase
MLGYWKDPKATAAIMMEDGWIRSGDQAMIRDGTIYITGRLKEIIVLATGEKVPPADMESAIAEDPLFDQVMVIGEQKPFLSALVVLNKDLWEQICRQQGKADTFCKLDYPAVETYLLERIAEHIKHFPGYAQIRKVTASYDPWTIENGLTTPTMKMKRDKIEKANSGKIQSMYAGH